MILSEINVYPIKSLGAVKLQHSKVLESGLELDRRWLLVDDKSKFVSQRMLPKMAMLGVEILDDSLRVFDKNNTTNELIIPFKLENPTEIIATVWDSEASSFVYPDSINQWFSNYLDLSLRLVKMNPTKMRHRELSVSPDETDMNYADGYPFLVLSRASVNYVSDQIGEEVDIRQFRANLILEDCNAFEEDELQKFSIAEVEFNMVKPCKRCQVIAINQDTGVSSKQPILFLSKTRKVEKHIIFGMNAALLGSGTIHVGDKISK